jgi:hypothetical protein
MTVVIKGHREIARAFAKLNKDFPKDLRKHLKEAAEPVRADAETLAGQSIRNLGSGDPWTQMRVGGGVKLVYIAPKQKGRASKNNPRKRRPNLRPLVLKQMKAALERNRSQVVSKAQDALRKAVEDWGRRG